MTLTIKSYLFSFTDCIRYMLITLLCAMSLSQSVVMASDTTVTYSGTLSGSDAGTWTMEFVNKGSYSEVNLEIDATTNGKLTGTGKLIIGLFSIVLSDGSSFLGSYDGSEVSGNWYTLKESTIEFVGSKKLVTATSTSILDNSTYAGTYSGDDTGTWTMKFYSPYSAIFAVTSAKHGWSLTDSSPVLSGNSFSAGFLGVLFEGSFDPATNKIAGSWKDSMTGDKGIFSGSAYSSTSTSDLSAYAGTYSGTFDGEDTGTWTTDISSAGDFTLKFTSDLDGSTDSGNGKITSAGVIQVTMVTYGSIVTGTVNPTTGTVTGTWINSEEDISGSLSGNKKSGTLPSIPKGSYDADTNKLTIPNITVKGEIYTNVVVTIDNVLSYNEGTPENAFQFDTDTGILTIPSVDAFGQTFTNVKTTIASVDSYNKGTTGGTGTGPVPSFDVLELTFPPQKVGTTSAAKTLILTNIGNAELKFTYHWWKDWVADWGVTTTCETPPGGLTLEQGGYLSLEAGESCNFSVTLTPISDTTLTAPFDLQLSLGETPNPIPDQLLHGYLEIVNTNGEAFPPEVDTSRAKVIFNGTSVYPLPPPPLPDKQSYEGTWSGTWAWAGPSPLIPECYFNDGGKFSMMLKQTGNDVSGTITGTTYGEGIETRSNSTCKVLDIHAGSGSVSADINGSTSGGVTYTDIAMEFTLSNLKFQGELNLSGNTLTGSFVRVDSTGGATYGRGEFTVTKIE